MNIQYPWDIGWLDEEGKPIGLFAILGWIEMTAEKLAQMEKTQKDGKTEQYSSDIYDASDLDD